MTSFVDRTRCQTPFEGKTVGFSQQYIELGYGLKADAQTALLNEWRQRYGN